MSLIPPQHGIAIFSLSIYLITYYLRISVRQRSWPNRCHLGYIMSFISWVFYFLFFFLFFFFFLFQFMLCKIVKRYLESFFSQDVLDVLRRLTTLVQGPPSMYLCMWHTGMSAESIK
ncbi:hypothetical protein GGR50DRAFT_669092 [Xylaria sp. CBS 124048]|nr:hypothetical protein GGR50DRAFT_669092 [Xylaria sp. CBS 124048]